MISVPEWRKGTSKYAGLRRLASTGYITCILQQFFMMPDLLDEILGLYNHFLELQVHQTVDIRLR